LVPTIAWRRSWDLPDTMPNAPGTLKSGRATMFAGRKSGIIDAQDDVPNGMRTLSKRLHLDRETGR
jgi:hypothetical protein